jgi:hypothetical protein
MINPSSVAHASSCGNHWYPPFHLIAIFAPPFLAGYQHRRMKEQSSWSLAFFFFESSQRNRHPSGPVTLRRPTLPSRSLWIPPLWLPPRQPCGPPLRLMVTVPWSPPSWSTFGYARHPAGLASLCHPKRYPLSTSASYLGSKRPSSAFGASPPRQVELQCRRPLAMHLDVHSGEDSACPSGQRQQGLMRKRMTTHCVARRRQ